MANTSFNVVRCATAVSAQAIRRLRRYSRQHVGGGRSTSGTAREATCTMRPAAGSGVPKSPSLMRRPGIAAPLRLLHHRPLSTRVRRTTMDHLMALFSDPTAWAALFALVIMEIVLGIDNLIFISILSNKLPQSQRMRARRIGIALALVMRLALLSMIAWLVGLTAPVFDLGWTGPLGAGGVPSFETQFSWRDLILIAGGLFLIWKATKEIHHHVDPLSTGDVFETQGKAVIGFGSVIVQIILLDMVFSVDSILTAVGMTDNLAVMVIAVIAAVGVMLLAADPLANFINRNPTVVMLALGFLLMIGAVLIADGFGVHVPKGYIYAAMAFSVIVEALNMLARRAKQRSAPPQP
jgi:predicted tellurium resistance membrane protein TerC